MKKKDINHVKSIFTKSIRLKKQIIEKNIFIQIIQMSDAIHECLKNKGKLLICGNGGSAADAQHLAAELLVRLRPHINRKSLPALALAQDTSTITACGNDYSFDKIFSRMIEGIGAPNDILLCISTSGNSKNIINALKIAKKMKIKSLGFLGSNGGKAIKLCDINFTVPSKETGRIQEAHITAGHALMELVENKFFDLK